LLRSAACFWQAPSPGERCAWAPLLRKLRAPSVVAAGVVKAWRAFLTFSTSTGDFRSLAAPRRETLSRKSGCLGRAVSLVVEEDESSSTDRPSLDWLPSGRRSLSSIARRMPRLFDLLLCLALTCQAAQMARSRPTHRISVGSDEGAAPGNDLYVSMQPAD
jgi:hypothetical protein